MRPKPREGLHLPDDTVADLGELAPGCEQLDGPLPVGQAKRRNLAAVRVRPCTAAISLSGRNGTAKGARYVVGPSRTCSRPPRSQAPCGARPPRGRRSKASKIAPTARAAATTTSPGPSSPSLLREAPHRHRGGKNIAGGGGTVGLAQYIATTKRDASPMVFGFALSEESSPRVARLDEPPGPAGAADGRG